MKSADSMFQRWSMLLQSAFLSIRRKHIIVFFTIAILYVPFLVKHGWGYRNIPNDDFPSFYSASILAFHYNESPYEPEHLHTVLDDVEKIYPYLYTPPNLIFFYPMSLFEYDTARRGLLLLNHLTILLMLIMFPLKFLRTASKRISLRLIILSSVCLLMFDPVVSTLRHGQINLLLLTCIIAFWILSKTGFPVLASLFLASAIILKTYPLIILPMLIVSRKKRELFYTLIFLLIGITASLVFLPAVFWHEWLFKVMPTGGYTNAPPGLFSPAAIWNQNLNGFFSRALTDNEWTDPLFVNHALARLLTWLSASLVVVISLYATWKSSRSHNESLDRTMIIAMPAMYLIAPLSWEHHLVLLLPSILMILTIRANLPPLPCLIFYTASLGSTIVIAVYELLKFNFGAVMIMWILSLIVALNERFKLANQDFDSTSDIPIIQTDQLKSS